jgi:2-polyprenyl-3-methyl-5-hydroxy-6-metoxy-1,4-benzoquinol methylase
VTTSFIDLGAQPLSNAYVAREDAEATETFYPLHVRACDACRLVQLPEVLPPERIFGEYAYLSSMSDSWVEHCRHYADSATGRLGLDARHLVVEVASNDGCLLRAFQARGVRVLGVEPARNVADIASAAGVPTLAAFFGSKLASELVSEGRRADLLVANNVLAHVPELNDFVRGIATLLADDGVATLEFPHLARLVAGDQFDTIYHEHFSYFSFETACRVMAAHGLSVFDVEELPTHGGSLRVHAARRERARDVSPRVGALLERERTADLHSTGAFARFAERVRLVKWSLLDFLLERARRGDQVVAYGAAAKGNTLLNYCGVHGDLLAYVADRSPLKQGKLLPGSRIPIVAPERIAETKPAYVLVLPWNIRDEIARQLAYVAGWGGQLVVPLPRLEILP